MTLAPGYGRAVSISANLMRFGESVGLPDSMSAARPATTPLANDVPLPRRYGSGIVDGNWSVMVAPGAASDTRCAPGATRSGFARPSATVGPCELKFGIESSRGLTVPLSKLAPTVRTKGSSPGLEMVPAPGPRLEAATTTVMPDFHACSTA